MSYLRELLERYEPLMGLDLEAQKPLPLYSMTVWGEARGEPFPSKVAVAQVVKLRSEIGGREFLRNPEVVDPVERIKEAVLEPWSFSCFNANDPNRPFLTRAPWVPSRAIWLECVLACETALETAVTSLVREATHYHSYGLKDRLAGRWPKWAADKAEVARVGRFRFYRLA